MGFPWFSETADWDALGKSVDIYFKRLGTEGTVIEVNGETFFVDFNNMKFPNEDNWITGEGNYYD